MKRVNVLERPVRSLCELYAARFGCSLALLMVASLALPPSHGIWDEESPGRCMRVLGAFGVERHEQTFGRTTQVVIAGSNTRDHRQNGTDCDAIDDNAEPNSLRNALAIARVSEPPGDVPLPPSVQSAFLLSCTLAPSSRLRC